MPKNAQDGAPANRSASAGAWARKNSRVVAARPDAVDLMAIPDVLVPTETERLIDNDKPSPFFGTTLFSTFHALGVDSVIIAGTSTRGCVPSTAVAAFSYTYPTVVVQDGCFERSLTSHAIALFDIEPRYGDAFTLEELRPMLGAPGVSR